MFTRPCGELVGRSNSETVKANRYVDILCVGIKRVYFQSSSIILETEWNGKKAG